MQRLEDDIQQLRAALASCVDAVAPKAVDAANAGSPIDTLRHAMEAALTKK